MEHRWKDMERWKIYRKPAGNIWKTMETDGTPMENRRKTYGNIRKTAMGNRWNTNGKQTEHRQRTYGNQWENKWKTNGNAWKSNGKPIETDGTPMETDGKPTDSL